MLPEADAVALSDALGKFATQPAFQCALEWEEGTLAIWDNQCCQHAVVPFEYDTQTRKMWRITVGEDELPLPRPVSATSEKCPEMTELGEATRGTRRVSCCGPRL